MAPMDFLLPKPILPRTLSSFKAPPLDGSLSVPQLIEWHFMNNKSHPVFIYDSSDLSDSACKATKVLTYSDVYQVICRAELYITHRGGIKIPCDHNNCIVVAMFAVTDTITYATTMMSLLRSRIIVFPISPRFSASVLAHLLHETNTTHIFISSEPLLHHVLAKALDIMGSKSAATPDVIEMPLFEELYTDQDGLLPGSLPPQSVDYNSTAIILHTSNSTSLFPKPIKWKARTCLQRAVVPCFNLNDLSCKIIGCHGIELFHTLGFLMLEWMLSSGFIMATFKPTCQPITPTPKNVFQGFRNTCIDYALGNPRFIETWSKDEACVSFLASLRGLIFGGNFVTDSAGSYLQKRGVVFCNSYGSTEMGVLAKVCPDDPGIGWQYFQVNPHASIEFVKTESGAFEVVIVPKITHDLAYTNAMHNGQAVFLSGDLAEPHPTKAGYWRILGRKDDQIMLSNGEVINPVGLENFLCEHDAISYAVIFGRAQPYLGVLIQLACPLQDSYKYVWPQVERMNSLVPKQSRISEDMIIFSSPSQSFPLNQKGAPKRAAALLQYQHEINALYASSKDQLHTIIESISAQTRQNTDLRAY